MKNLLRSVPAVFLALVAAAAAALLLLYVFPPEKKLIQIAQQAAREHLHREIGIRRLTFSLRGLRMEGVTVSRRPDFGAGTLLVADAVNIRFDLPALLRRTVHVRLLEIISPDIEVPVPGDLNRQAAMIAAAPVYATRRAAAAFPSVRIDEVRVSRAVARAVRHPGGRALLTLRNCSGSAVPVAAGEPAAIVFAATAEIGSVQFPVAGRFMIAASGDAVTVEEATIRQNNYALTVAGVVAGLDHPRDARVQLTLTGDRALLDTISLLAAIPPTLRIFSHPTLALAITGTPRALRITSTASR